MTVTRVDRGWAGHFICSHSCLFRLNTLLIQGRKRIVVSTVGNMRGDKKVSEIGLHRYYETMAFKAIKLGPYWDTDVTKPVEFFSPWGIFAKSASELPADVDNKANEMHEAVVAELSRKLCK